MGQGRDWDFLALRDAGFLGVEAWNLFAPGHAPLGDFAAESLRLLDHIAARDDDPVLLGYSLGARLALHAALARPGFFRALILAAPNFGLSNESERATRIAADEQWAERFRHEAWTPLMAAWNAQQIFRAGAPVLPVRQEDDFDREQLARSLRFMGLGRQENLRPRLAELKLPVWLGAGGEDLSCAAGLAAVAPQIPHAHRAFFAGHGHRFPWSAPREFRPKLRLFLVRLFALETGAYERAQFRFLSDP